MFNSRKANLLQRMLGHLWPMGLQRLSVRRRRVNETSPWNLPVSTGLAYIGTIVTKRVASMYIIGKKRLTLIGLGRFGWAHRSHGKHSTDTPMLNCKQTKSIPFLAVHNCAINRWNVHCRNRVAFTIRHKLGPHSI